MQNLIDQYGQIDQQIKALETQKAEIKKELLVKGLGKHEGTQFFIEVQEYNRENISAVLVRKVLSKDLINQVTQIQHVQAVLVKPLN
jgi:hypothetical protein